MKLPPFYAQTRIAGGLVFVSGQLAFSSDKTCAVGDLRSQTLTCLERIEAALDPLGLDRSAIVRCGCWLADPAEFDAFNSAYAEFFAGCIAPARTTVAALLCLPGARVEIDAVATLDKPKDASQPHG